VNADSKNLFEILVRENAAMLRVYLSSAVRDPATVDDLFQDTMLVAWQTIDRFDRSRPFGPWLRGIAGKLVLAHRRKSAATKCVCNEMMLEQFEKRLSALHRQSGDRFDEKLDCLRQCLTDLPELLREAIVQRYAKHLSRAEMVERLNITDEAVKKRLQRARSKLLECILHKLDEGGRDA